MAVSLPGQLIEFGHEATVTILAGNVRCLKHYGSFEQAYEHLVGLRIVADERKHPLGHHWLQMHSRRYEFNLPPNFDLTILASAEYLCERRDS